MKIIARNKRASFDFKLVETYEVGLVLQGTEVKALRAGKVRLQEAFISVDKKGEAFIHNLYIGHYDHGNIHNHIENRKRKLLLHKRELVELDKRARAESLTIIPLKIYFKKSYVKLEIALAKGKKLYDKRQDQAKKQVERDIKRKIFSR